MIILFLILLFALSRSVDATTLSDAATALSAGHWSSPITTTNFANGDILRISGGSTLEYMDKAVWDPIDNTVLIWGGAHATPGGFLFSRYSEATNSWVNNLPIIADNGHGYHHNTLVPSTGDYYHRDYYSTMKTHCQMRILQVLRTTTARVS